MCKVTVIMPSFNVVAYIRECMESVVNQTLKDIEILAIDAGSTDGTLAVLQEYAANDSRIQIIHSDRKSYGYQVNMGIRLAKGRYVGIVETDDVIEKDMYEALYDVAEQSHVDYVKGTGMYYRKISEAIKVQEKIRYFSLQDGIYGQVIDPQERPELFVIDRFLWLGLYRREFIEDIRLQETAGAAFQDIGFAFQVISNAKRAVYLDKPIYYYREDNTGASAYNRQGFQYLADEYLEVIKQLAGKENGWYCVCYKKMMQQTLGRFIAMAYSGSFWEEAEEAYQTIRIELERAVGSGYLTKERLGEKMWNRLQSMLAGSHEIYNELVGEADGKAAVLQEFFRKINNRQVVVFGCGALGKFVHALIEYRYPGKVVAYCDNAQSFQNTMIQGISVIQPTEAAECYSKAAYVITGRNSENEMQQQLLDLGIDITQMVVYLCGVDRMLFRIL